MKTTSLLFAIFLMVNQLADAQSVTLSTTTLNPTKGTVVYNNATNQLQYWDGSAWIPITNAASGTGWALSGTNIYNSTTGNVGIKVANPNNLLQIGSMGGTGFADTHLAIGNGTGAMGLSQANELTTMASSTNITLKPRNGVGHVGINTNTPTNALQIGSPNFSNYDLAMGTGANGTGFRQRSTEFLILSTTHINLNPGFGTGGGVGIYASGSVPRGPLDVGISKNSGQMAHAFFYYNNNTGNHVIGSTPSSSIGVSIYAFGGIVANAFCAYSDARIKNIVGISNSAQDLATIKALQITDYTLKDHIQHGNKPFKKVIAQQIEKVYPQAVSQVTDVVPDIYVLAEKVVFDQKSKTLICTLAKSYDIKIGEKIEFIHPTAGKLKAEVIEVSGNSFTVKDWQQATDKIFVYGREVNDFRSVDYEALSMLGISAIQQLAKENEEMKAENKELKIKLEQLKSDFSARLEAIEAQLAKAPTGN